MTAPTLSIQSLSRRVKERGGSRWLFRGLSLSIASTERVCFVGPNGSGKSTLLRIILGAEHSDGGVAALSPEIATLHVSYVPQDYRNALFPWLRLRHNLTVTLDGRRALKRFLKTACRLRLRFDLHKFPYQLSGGEQQLFLLAQALARSPQLLILDEAFSAVDSARRALGLTLVDEYLADSPCTLLLVTHNVDDAVMLADRVIVLSPATADIRGVIQVSLPRPRTRTSPRFQDLVNRIEESAT